MLCFILWLCIHLYINSTDNQYVVPHKGKLDYKMSPNNRNDELSAQSNKF
ncbi:hypothetical protein VCR4J5_280009 [Vibrio crassostreae]|uniref:Uncharacterized protein n=1 Tax=Vibrio crassostreae TaxID=246167 RepID=A0ABM9QW38_9VIBR|nr:hypothetical protein VCR19J5_110010 [Vibrio crassostreae]CDT43153.1 hypothetical protein VCR4J5_280009 [Vibrio crassostreae]